MSQTNLLSIVLLCWLSSVVSSNVTLNSTASSTTKSHPLESSIAVHRMANGSVHLSQGTSCSSNSDCTANARCVSGGSCACTVGFLLQGTECVKKKCESHNDCQNWDGTVCSLFECECDKNHVLDTDGTTCVLSITKMILYTVFCIIFWTVVILCIWWFCCRNAGSGGGGGRRSSRRR